MTTPNAEVVIFGSSRNEESEEFKLKSNYVGRIYDDATLAILYSAADVMVVPSEQENLSNTIMESLSCGTPIVCFDIGGNKDLVSHKENGYLVKPFNENDLADGIDWVLEQIKVSNHLSLVSRNSVLQNFQMEKVALEHQIVYKEAMGYR